MALNKEHNSHIERLVIEAAAEVKALDPRLGSQEHSLSDAEYQELEQARRALEHIWDEIDRQVGGSPVAEAGAQAVDEDRGE
jgi:hypothetical protein